WQRGNPGKRSGIKAQQMPGRRDKRDGGDDQRPRRHQHDVRRATASAPLLRERMRRKPEAWDGGVDAGDEPCRGEQRAVHGRSLQFTVNSSQLEELRNCRTAELRNCRTAELPNCMAAMKTQTLPLLAMATLQRRVCT